jgi:hypothetical protein
MTINKFFTHLSERLNDENGLSDVTYAFLKADSQLAKLFMGHFNFDFDATKPYEVLREFADDDCRPDFRIEQDEKVYIIENKIYDVNDHFPQYADKFGEAGRGFIANYRADEETAKRHSFTCTTWGAFVNELEGVKKSDVVFDDKSWSLLQAYIKYVREVCCIVKLKEIRFDNIDSLYHFNKLTEQVILSSVAGYECSLYKGGKSFSETGSGWYFSMKKKGGRTEIYPWFGIWYGDEDTIIYMSFSKSWCKPVQGKYPVKGKSGIYFDKSYINRDDDNALEFPMTNEKWQEFKDGDLERQKVILQSYFTEVIREVGEYL